MLYLIRTFGRGKETALKVGFTDDNRNRSNQYKLHNPLYEPISTREGGLYEETKMHLYLTALNLKRNILKEWFEDCPETLTQFHASIGKINRTIWKNRSRLFTRADFKGENMKNTKNTKNAIYEELRMIYYNPNRWQIIDNEWKIEYNQKLLKRMRSDSRLLD